MSYIVMQYLKPKLIFMYQLDFILKIGKSYFILIK